MATATKAVWKDHLILESSKPDPKTGLKKEWKVQINEEGQFRCNCPSYIFSKKVPKTCKHCHFCEEGRGTVIPGATSVAPVRPPIQPNVAEATKMFTEMCSAATKATKFNVGNHLGHVATKAMIEVLSVRLAVYVVPTVTGGPVETIGVRRITFDED